MVMNMYSLLESKNGQISMEEVENSFGGNICRCTGYRSILDAFKSLAYDADEKLVHACMVSVHIFVKSHRNYEYTFKDIEDLNKTCPKKGSKCGGQCHKVKENVTIAFPNERHWFKATTVEEIYDLFQKFGDVPYMFVAGNTAHG